MLYIVDSRGIQGLFLTTDALAHLHGADENGIGRTFDEFSRLKGRNGMQHMV